MQILRLAPVALSLLLLAAHLFRAGWPLAIAALCALLPLSLVGGRTSAVRAMQLVLVAGAGEWLRTAVVLIAARRAVGLPHLRLAVILGAISVFTALAAVALESWHRHRARAVEALEVAA